jgi:hypothetical protein
MNMMMAKVYLQARVCVSIKQDFFFLLVPSSVVVVVVSVVVVISRSLNLPTLTDA